MAAEKIQAPHKFGTFAGVFLPSVLTIFGLIMFMRLGFVVGNVGVIGALVILGVSQGISLLTSFSMAAISSNTPVKEGGAYFLISRTLGPGIGGAIGVVLFFAQALAVPFYILGFVEAFVKTFEGLDQHFFVLLILTAVILFIIAWVGADWAIKTQFLIFVILSLAILTYIIGLTQNFDVNVLKQNLEGKPDVNYFLMFAIFFPAVTGIMSGVNMSGDLENPSRSIIRGTFWAVAVSAVVYAIHIVLAGGAFPRVALIYSPYKGLVDIAFLKLGFLVTAGVFAATLSSALGSFLGAPRILQALSQDGIFPKLSFFKKLSGAKQEPRRALVLTMIITIIVLVAAAIAAKSGSNALNIVAALVAMFFLYTYGMVNTAAFVESFGSNPSFRPRFRRFHWTIAFIGGAACFIVSFLINGLASMAALGVVAFLFWYSKKRESALTFVDARSGFIYSRIRENLLMLSQMIVDAKNWRPTITVFTSSLQKRKGMIKMASGLGGNTGILSCVEFMNGDFFELREKREEKLVQAKKYISENHLPVFPEVVICRDYDNGITIFFQSHSVGPIKPNIIMLGWPLHEDRIEPYFKHMRMIASLGLSCLVYITGEPEQDTSKPNGQYIDIWWGDDHNDSLMLLLAYLLNSTMAWNRCKIRLVKDVNPDEMSEDIEKSLKAEADTARIDVEVKLVPCDDKDRISILKRTSMSSAIVFIGFDQPEKDQYHDYYNRTKVILKNMPPVLMVNSMGEADLSV